MHLRDNRAVAENMKGDTMPVREGESLRRGKKVLKHKKMLQF